MQTLDAVRSRQVTPGPAAGKEGVKLLHPHG
jgi:hypothetical protein